MRVKITYTVELEQVEKETSEIMCRASSNIDDAYQEITNLQAQLDTGTGDADRSLKSIHFARLKLAKADQVLEDCYHILQSLQDVKKQMEQQNEIQDG